MFLQGILLKELKAFGSKRRRVTDIANNFMGVCLCKIGRIYEVE
jgi:hypothetical protein